MFSCYRATWAPTGEPLDPSSAADERHGTVVGACEREAAVYALAQLRAAFFDIRERRIVFGAAEHLAGRNGVAHRAEVAFGGRHVGVCVIERLTETLHG